MTRVERGPTLETSRTEAQSANSLARLRSPHHRCLGRVGCCVNRRDPQVRWPGRGRQDYRPCRECLARHLHQRTRLRGRAPGLKCKHLQATLRITDKRSMNALVCKSIRATRPLVATKREARPRKKLTCHLDTQTHRCHKRAGLPQRQVRAPASIFCPLAQAGCGRAAIALVPLL